MTGKGIYSGRSGLFQSCVLLLFFLVGFVLTSVLSLFFLPVNDSPAAMRCLQLVSVANLFLLPAFALAWLCGKSVREYLFIGVMPSGKVIRLIVLSMIAISPMISLTAFFNGQMILPSFLEPVEVWMREQEDIMKEATDFLLSDRSVWAFLANFIVIGLVAAVTEEFFFRGAMQRIVEKWVQNYHTVIWLVAFLFSAIHLQFYGFIPRLLLGAYFGYLLFWSKNIWLPMLAHLVNNTLVLIVESSALKENRYMTGEVESGQLPVYSVIAVVGLIIFIRITKSIRKECGRREEITIKESFS